MNRSRTRTVAAEMILQVLIGIIVLSLILLVWEWHGSHRSGKGQQKEVAAAHHHKSKHGKSGGKTAQPQ